MPEGDDVYVTIAGAIPYVNYVVTAFKIIEGMYDFGRESEEEKAIRLLNERVERLEQYVRDLDERLSQLEARVAQNENRARLRVLREHQLEFSALARDLASRPGDAGDVADKALRRLRAMIDDHDIWLWSDVMQKPQDAPSSWRPAPAQFKGVPVPTFAVGAMLWALAAHLAIAAGAARASYVRGADQLLGWVATAPNWVPYLTPPRSISERFRAAVKVEVRTSTRYVTPSGHCEYALVAVNDIDRTRTAIRDVRIYVGPATNTMCTIDPRIADHDEARLEDEFPQLRTLRTVEDALTRIRQRGTLADPLVGRFPGWTAHRLTLYGIEPSGIMRRFELDTTTALTEPPTVRPVGDVVGTGWQHFEEVLATDGTVVYAFSGNGALDWYRHDDVTRGPAGWSGPRRLVPPSRINLFQSRSPVNGGGGTFLGNRTSMDQLRVRNSLELLVHDDPARGTGGIRSSQIVADWRGYPTTFGGGAGVFYGIDEAGDLYWHRHTSWPRPGRRLEGPVKIGNGWDVFTRVIAFGHGFIAGLYPNGVMLLYHFRQWRWGPGKDAPIWNGPTRVPGTHWRGFATLVPMVGDAPSVVH